NGLHTTRVIPFYTQFSKYTTLLVYAYTCNKSLYIYIYIYIYIYLFIYLFILYSPFTLKMLNLNILSLKN
ncbi:MAG: hypothetical protein NW900_02675, partial [Candidatus Blochmannia sp. A2]|nr:hypothetical protein [Candidatus Blochmannia sp. A2]